jgi:hypothetical protein
MDKELEENAQEAMWKEQSESGKNKDGNAHLSLLSVITQIANAGFFLSVITVSQRQILFLLSPLCR